ncbi:MAG: hypothetical protein A3F78_03840 [Burkholderiales bacterium RIFCSPLOWO2_12_FULL_61_40]|nr:MAG: hypothetical protein A3F78_03840 [Burkholderiales bacterium RIFCSPLOWO2_12_FULL_61_40]
MRAEDRIRLKHMVEAGQAALKFVDGRKSSDLQTDQMLLFLGAPSLACVTAWCMPTLTWTRRWSGRRFKMRFLDCSALWKR